MSNTDRLQPFYLVWNVGGGTPTVRHENYQKARTGKRGSPCARSSRQINRCARKRVGASGV